MKKQFMSAKNGVVTIVAGLAVTIALSATARAVPSLQVYVPGATYDAAEETWVTGSTDFEVWVVASKAMYDVEITAALDDGEDPFGGSVSIGGSTYTGADFTSGAHPYLAPHGIFPADWVNHDVGNMTTMTANTVADFNSGYVHGVTPLDKVGQIIKLNVSISGFNSIHFDAWGFDGRERFRFAAFSHDGGTGGTPVPEPATVLLMTLGAGGMGLVRRFRKK